MRRGAGWGGASRAATFRGRLAGAVYVVVVPRAEVIRLGLREADRVEIDLHTLQQVDDR